MTEPTRTEVETAQATNDQRIRDLAPRGVAVTQEAINTARWNYLIEHLLGDMDDPRRLAFEMALSGKMADALSDEAIGKAAQEAAAAQARARLLEGVIGQQVPGR